MGTSPASARRRVRLFLIDDHDTYRDCLKAAIDAESGLHVVGESVRARGSLERVMASGAEVVLVDLDLVDADGVDVCNAIVSRSGARCIVLTSVHASEADLVRAGRAGASAYAVKGAPLAELVDSIRAVAGDGGRGGPSRPGVHRYSPTGTARSGEDAGH